MEIKENKFWIVNSEKSKNIFDNEKDAIIELKERIKKEEKSVLQMFLFKGEEMELKQIGWETIAKQVIKNEN